MPAVEGPTRGRFGDRVVWAEVYVASAHAAWMSAGSGLDGVTPDREFEDQASVKDMNRPQLEEMIRFVRDGGHGARAFDGPARAEP